MFYYPFLFLYFLYLLVNMKISFSAKNKIVDNIMHMWYIEKSILKNHLIRKIFSSNSATYYVGAL